MSKPSALITGATSGFGKAIAESLARENLHQLILTGRRKERLEIIAEELRSRYGAEVLTRSFDVRDQVQVFSTIAELPDNFRNIRLLVNNAGLAAGRDNAEDASVADWDQMIDTNIKGLSYMTKAVLPMLIASGNGHLINIGSIAGKESYAGGSMYCASKHAVDAFTKALRIELLKHGVKVSQICPGAAETEFSLVRLKGDAIAAQSVYQGFSPLSADDIADAFMYIINCPAHVCVNEMIITPTAQANSYSVFRKPSIQ